jgi:hypothetical protein
VARPDPPPGRDAGRRPPRPGEPPPHDNLITRQGAEVTLESVTDGAASGRCPRCGQLLSATSDVDLVLCTALARGAVEERAAGGLCPSCAAGLAS